MLAVKRDSTPYVARTMTIVTNRGPHRKRPRPAQPAAIAVPRIVQMTPRSTAWKVRPLPPVVRTGLGGSLGPVAHIVQRTPQKYAWKPGQLPPDPEAEASVREFLARMIRPR
jgi:hypothetical protein